MTALATPDDDDENNRMAKEKEEKEGKGKEMLPRKEERGIVARFQKYQIDSNNSIHRAD